MLDFERDLMADAEPRQGEYDELAREAHRLKNADQIQTAAAAGYSVLYESDRSAQDVLTMVARSLQPLAQAAPELAQTTLTLLRLADETREVAFSLRDIGQRSDQDPARLEEIETRLALHRRLAARFHCSVDELSQRRAAIEAKLEEIDKDDAALHAMDEPLAAAWAILVRTAGQLSVARCKLARDFARVIQRRLKPLGLGGARLIVAVETRALGNDPTAIATLPIRGSMQQNCSFRQILVKNAVRCARSRREAKAVSTDARDQNRARGRRPRSDDRARRDRRGRREGGSARRGAGTRRAGSTPSRSSASLIYPR